MENLLLFCSKLRFVAPLLFMDEVFPKFLALKSRSCMFMKGCGPCLQLFLFSVVHCRVRGLIRLLSKRTESHLSCQIQLCAPLASKREEIFHFPHFGFYSPPLFCVCVCA